jgi:dihydrofolate synthase/folylpolyglutamate synthase
MSVKLDTYRAAWDYLDEMQMHKIKLGLEAMQQILSRLGSPEQACPAVHVAGTNGKGSVCAMLRSIMTAAGYRTGLYTSPHLSSVRERFRIDAQYISETDFTRLMEQVRQGLDGDRITYFECTTTLAFSWFAENDCDLVILETGMGGRLDATNVVTPLLSIITTISLDHEQYLGDTIAAVAFEKAGIIKPEIPLISGVTGEEAARVIGSRSDELQAPVSLRSRDFRLEAAGDNSWTWRNADNSVRVPGIVCGPGGAWQVDNTSVAVAGAVALRDSGYTIPDSAIINGIANTVWPARMELLELDRARFDMPSVQTAPGAQLRFLLDGAHNPAGVEYLVQALREQISYRSLYVIWGSMGDKDYRDMLLEIAGLADTLLLTRAESERSATTTELAAALDQQQGKIVEQHPEMDRALQAVLSRATPDDLIVVAGSLYLVGEFRKLLVGEVVD